MGQRQQLTQCLFVPHGQFKLGVAFGQCQRTRLDHLFQVLIGLRQLAAGMRQLDMRTHPRQHLFGLKRLGDVIDATRAKGQQLVFRFLQRADEYNGQVASQGHILEPATDFIAIHSRHAHIEQNQIRQSRLRRT